MRESPSDRRPAVGTLYEQFGPALYRYALMLLADPAAAEDVVQQVFTALLRPGGATLDRPEHYLRRAVRNECYSALRRRGTRAEQDARQPLLEPVAASTPAPDEQIVLERALRQLPPEQREVIHLHVFEGWTFKEIAEDQQESINTIASRYRYALEKLRAVFDM